MKFLVTGVYGQLGYDVVKELKSRGFNDILECDIDVMDITNEKQTNNIIKSYNPDVVIHCAAYTAVDKAEDDCGVAYSVNVTGTKNITNACKKINSKLIYISTDYVFDGKKDLNEIYETTDICNPNSVYGKTKYLGEQEVLKHDKSFVVRTSWVFGINGKNFVKTMLNLATTRSEVGVVCDQFGSPTYTVDLAKLLVDMSLTDKYGIYHANNEGYCSWAEFAEKIFDTNDLNVKVNKLKTEEYPTKAERPKNSKLSKAKLVENGFELLPSWEDALIRYKNELKNGKGKQRRI